MPIPPLRRLPAVAVSIAAATCVSVTNPAVPVRQVQIVSARPAAAKPVVAAVKLPAAAVSSEPG